MKKKVLFVSLILLINIIFIDIAFAETYNNFDPNAGPVSCGNSLVTGIPSLIPSVLSVLYNIIQIAIPIILVILGSIDFMKSVSAGKEDEMKKGQQLFIKRLISAVLVFLVFLIVKLVISLVADDEKTDNKAMRIMQCAECFIDKNCD